MEYSFTPGSIHIGLGKKVKITLDNKGQVEHDFEIIGTSIHINAAAGKKSSMILCFNKKKAQVKEAFSSFPNSCPFSNMLAK